MNKTTAIDQTYRIARLAQLVEHQTFNLRVKGSSPLSGVQFFFSSLSDFFFFPRQINDHVISSHSEVTYFSFSALFLKLKGTTTSINLSQYM